MTGVVGTPSHNVVVQPLAPSTMPPPSTAIFIPVTWALLGSNTPEMPGLVQVNACTVEKLPGRPGRPEPAGYGA